MKIKSNRLISMLLSIVMCLTVLTGAAWALTGLFEVGMSIQVTYDPLVDAKVYLSTDSAGAETTGLKQMKADYSKITAKNFVKENSALVLNTHDDDKNSGAKTKGQFEALGKDSASLICDANGEMQFYVYVENYSETESVYYRANISFNGETPEGETTPFNVTENPPCAVSEAVSDSTGGGRVTSSLLAFKIALNSEFEGDIRADQITIEIELYSFESVSTLESSSWNIINQISELGWASHFFKVGDEKTITLTTSEEVTFVILGFNHDDKSDGSGKAGITFGMKNLLATQYKMNSSNTNSGGWNGCLMRTSTMASLLTQLPSDLRLVIKEVNKLATAGSKSPSILTSPDKLFLFSEREIDGTTDPGYEDEGSQYAYWVGKNAADRIKRLSNDSGSPNTWWLRSPRIGSIINFRYFNSDGNVYYIDANNTYGVCFGFCV